MNGVWRQRLSPDPVFYCGSPVAVLSRAAPGHFIPRFARKRARVDFQDEGDGAGRCMNAAGFSWQAGLQGDGAQNAAFMTDPNQVDGEVHLPHPEAIPIRRWEAEPHTVFRCQRGVSRQAFFTRCRGGCEVDFEGLRTDMNVHRLVQCAGFAGVGCADQGRQEGKQHGEL